MSVDLQKFGPWSQEPLVWFLALGFLIFLVAVWRGDHGGDSVIEITQGDIQSLSDQWLSQNNRPPSEEELEGLIASHIQDEVFYREALRLGLAANDVIVRRRLVQKLNFLISDTGMGQLPSEKDLKIYYQKNTDKYAVPQRWSFKHRYFSVDSRTEAKSDALQALADPANSGDPFFLNESYQDQAGYDIRKLFGSTFADGLAGLSKEEGWQGPVLSSYGWHLVWVEDLTPARQLTFDEVRENVTDDYIQDRIRQANRNFTEKLISRYKIRQQ